MPLALDSRFSKVNSKSVNKLYIGLVIALVISIIVYIVSVVITNKLRTARNNPWIIEGVREANKPLVLSQNIGDDGSIPIRKISFDASDEGTLSVALGTVFSSSNGEHSFSANDPPAVTYSWTHLWTTNNRSLSI